MGVFDTIDIHNLELCPGEEFFSGLSTRLYYAPASFFFKTPLPDPDTSFESEIIITDEIMMYPGKKIRYVDILIDENELKVTPLGNPTRKKVKTVIELYILGFTPSILGFLHRCMNESLIFFIKDSNGNNWQIGTLRNRSFIENFEGTTGKKVDDNSGLMLTISCNSSLFIYTNSLESFAIPGDFNNDFNNDFYISNNDN